MNFALALRHFLFPKTPKTPVVEVKAEPAPEKHLRNFSYFEAVNGAKFRLRNGNSFTVINMNHQIDGDPRPYILLSVEGFDRPVCYYSDGIFNELEFSGFDLVMVD